MLRLPPLHTEFKIKVSLYHSSLSVRLCFESVISWDLEKKFEYTYVYVLLSCSHRVLTSLRLNSTNRSLDRYLFFIVEIFNLLSYIYHIWYYYFRTITFTNYTLFHYNLLHSQLKGLMYRTPIIDDGLQLYLSTKIGGFQKGKKWSWNLTGTSFLLYKTQILCKWT